MWNTIDAQHPSINFFFWYRKRGSFFYLMRKTRLEETKYRNFFREVSNVVLMINNVAETNLMVELIQTACHVMPEGIYFSNLGSKTDR